MSLAESFDLPFFISVTLLLDVESSTKEDSWSRRALASFSASLRAATYDSMSVLPHAGGLLVDMVYKRMRSGGIRRTSSMKR